MGNPYLIEEKMAAAQVTVLLPQVEEVLGSADPPYRRLVTLAGALRGAARITHEECLAEHLLCLADALSLLSEVQFGLQRLAAYRVDLRTCPPLLKQAVALARHVLSETKNQVPPPAPRKAKPPDGAALEKVPEGG